MKKLFNASLILSLLLICNFNIYAQTITNVSPSVGTVGTTVTLTINGQNTMWYTATDVWITQGVNYILATNVNPINDTIIQAEIGIPVGTSIGQYHTTVYNAMTNDSISLLNSFTIVANPNPPVLTNVNPGTANAGTTLSVSISGQNTNFQQGTTTVWFNQGSSTIYANAVNVNSLTQLNANFDIPSFAATGIYSTNVYNPTDLTITSLGTFNITPYSPFTPAITISGNTTFCDGDSVMLTSSSTTGNLWNNGQTTQSITVFSSGNYFVSVSDTNGTFTSNPIFVTVNPIPATPVISSSGPLSFCPGTILTLTSNYNFGNQWSNGQYTKSISIDAPVSLNLTHTNSYGCSSLPAAVVASFSSNIALPLFSIADNSITSNPATATFNNLTPNLSQYDFVWNFGDGSSAIDNNAFVDHDYNTNGNFEVALTLIDPVSGCAFTNFNPNNSSQIVTCNASLNNNCNFSPTLNYTGVLSLCIGGMLNISVNNGSYPAGATFQWNKNGVPIGGETYPTYKIISSGNYSVTVYSSSGCPVLSPNTQVSFSLAAVSPPTITENVSANYCSLLNTNLYASGVYGTYLWNNGQMTNINSAFNVTQPGLYSVTGMGGVGCSATSDNYNVSTSSITPPEICIITVDSATNNAVIVWEKDVTNAISGYGIYKETSMYSNYFQQIAVVPHDSLSLYMDVNSNAAVLTEGYRISIIDTCGGETAYSEVARAIGLKVFPGIANQRQLSWNNYLGNNPNIIQYKIFSGYNSNQLTLLDSVAPNIGTYIDVAPVNGVNTVYKIAVDLNSLCVPTRDINLSISNIAENVTAPFVQGTNEISSQENIDFNIVPNPNNGAFMLTTSFSKNSNSYTVNIYDVFGNIVYSTNFVSGKEYELNLENLNNGVYLIKLNTLNKIINKRLVINK